MPTLTSKAYRNQRNALAKHQSEVQAILDRLPNARAAITTVADRNKDAASDHKAEQYREINNAIGETFNALHDLMDLLNKELRDLDAAWERRDWTAADYASHELVVQNID